MLDEVRQLLDEQLAHAVVDDEMSLRAAGAEAGMTENAVGPRLGATVMLAPYVRPDGRITAKEVQRARYDKKNGMPAPAPAATPVSKPMRFTPRRTT